MKSLRLRRKPKADPTIGESAGEYAIGLALRDDSGPPSKSGSGAAGASCSIALRNQQRELIGSRSLAAPERISRSVSTQKDGCPALTVQELPFVPGPQGATVIIRMRRRLFEGPPDFLLPTQAAAVRKQ